MPECPNCASMTFDLSAWYASGSVLVVLVLIGLAGYAFHTSLAGRQLFKDELL